MRMFEEERCTGPDTYTHLLAGYQSNMDEASRFPPPHSTKVFVQRDYSEGTMVRFQTKFPQELEDKIDPVIFQNTMTQINNMCAEAESLTSTTYCESCFACLTAYVAYLCMETYYEKTLKKLNRYIQEQNENIYLPRGLMLVDPASNGLRVVEVCIFSDGPNR